MSGYTALISTRTILTRISLSGLTRFPLIMFVVIASLGMLACDPPPPCPSGTELLGELPPKEEAALNEVAGKRFKGACVISGAKGPLRHGFEKTWYRGGRIIKSHYTYEGGVRHGEYSLYFPDGVLRETGSYRFGLKHGKYKTFHRNGKPHIEGEYQDDKKDGDFVVYSNNGMHIQKGPYFLDVKHGLWRDTYTPLEGKEITLVSNYHYGRAIMQ